MADKKISALTGANTPLAGTEVLPIVQSGATVKVAVSDLTAGRAISATQITLTTGNVIVASGQGIDFSATSGTGTSELLADYEEGTWTPSIVGSTSNSGQAYTSQVGKYTKIGRQVNVQFHIVFSAEGTFVGSLLALSGLPYTISNDVPAISGGMLQFGSMGTVFTTVGLQLNQNSTVAFLTAVTAATTGTGYVGTTDLTNTTLLTGQFTYFV
jgi:hypothetical protein